MLENIKNQNVLFAIILRANYKKNGIKFFTDRDISLQLGYMNRPKGYQIDPHFHKKIEKIVNATNEALFIKSGKVKVDFYDNKKKYFASKILKKGDVVLLIKGGHGFKMLEKSEMIEIKQGPYINDAGKVIFKSTKK